MKAPRFTRLQSILIVLIISTTSAITPFLGLFLHPLLYSLFILPSFLLILLIISMNGMRNRASLEDEIFQLRLRLHHEQKEFQVMSKAAGILLVKTDQWGAIKYVNRHTEEILGYSQGELLNRVFQNQVIEFHSLDEIQGIATLETESYRTLDAKGNEINVEWTLQPLHEAQDFLILGKSRHDLHKLEHEFIQATLKAQKLKDIRNGFLEEVQSRYAPLISDLGYTSRKLYLDHPEDPEIQELGKISSELDIQMKQISDFLHLELTNNLTERSFSLTELFKSVWYARPQDQGGYSFVLIRKDNLPEKIFGDPEKTKLLFLYLLRSLTDVERLRHVELTVSSSNTDKPGITELRIDGSLKGEIDPDFWIMHQIQWDDSALSTFREMNLLLFQTLCRQLHGRFELHEETDSFTLTMPFRFEAVPVQENTLKVVIFEHQELFHSSAYQLLDERDFDLSSAQNMETLNVQGIPDLIFLDLNMLAVHWKKLLHDIRDGKYSFLPKSVPIIGFEGDELRISEGTRGLDYYIAGSLTRENISFILNNKDRIRNRHNLLMDKPGDFKLFDLGDDISTSVLTIFLHDIPIKMLEIENAFNDNRKDAIPDLIHSMTNYVSVTRVHSAVQDARKLERLANLRQFSRLKEEYLKYRPNLEKLIEGIQDIVLSRSA
jgi:PAS domain S-box-containing protein